MISSKLMPWYMASFRKEFVRKVTIPIRVSTAFMEMWVKVYFSEPYKS